MKCEQPGCKGTIVDGYCDVCGMPPSELATVATAAPKSAGKKAAKALAAKVVAVDGTRCAQPGCSGTIVDGYCNVCGTPGGTPSSATRSAAGVAGTSSTPSLSNQSSTA